MEQIISFFTYFFFFNSWVSPELREIESNILLNTEMLLRHMLTMHLMFEGAIDSRIANRIWVVIPLLNEISIEVHNEARYFHCKYSANNNHF